MKMLSFMVFKGRNIYSHKKCIRLNLDLEGYSEIPSKEIYNFNDKLVCMLPELNKHRCAIDEDRGFIKRLTEGTYLAHITEHIILALHNMIGLDVSYGKAREISGDNYYVIYQYEYKNTGIEAANIAVDFVNSLINNEVFDLGVRLNRLKEILMGEQLGISTSCICTEAKKRGIPILKIGEESMFQLGYGKYSKIIQATMGSDTSVIAVNIAQDKLLTKQVLSMNCLPVPYGMKVVNMMQTISCANEIGYPVVLKPQFGNQGKGVISNIKNEKQLVESYELLAKKYVDIIIEKYINGRDYRVCCVYGDIVAVSERIPPYIIGDGINAIDSLIENINKDLRRGEGHEKELTKIKIDEGLIEYLKQKGYTLNSVLPEKEKLYLKDNANLSTGGFAIDCTDLISDENIEICKRVASAIGLDICGIDVRCEDIGKSLNEGGVIIEINAAPGIRMHHNPYFGKSRNVAGHIIDKLFKDIPRKIPLISVTGTNGKTTTTRLISHILSNAGYTVGMTTTSGIYIDGKCIRKGDTTGPKSALTVLMNKNIDAAVLETARGGMIREGLAYDLADVAVITNITEDHLGLYEVETIEDLAKVKALVGEAVKKDGYVVINGDDKMSISILPRFKSNLIIFSNNKDNKIMRTNIKNGGYGIYVDEGYLIIQNSTNYEKLIDIESIGITFKGILKYNIQNAMAACAAAVGIGIGYDIIKQGLKTFYCNFDQNPGRFNMYLIDNVKVILDYGHNIDGYKCVLDGLKNIRHNKLIGIIGVPGDRSDSHIMDVGRCAGENFDYIFVKEDEDRRGRDKGKVADLLEKGVLKSNFNIINIKKVLDEKEAFKTALGIASPGDIVIIFFDKYEPIIEIIKSEIYKKECQTNRLLEK
ncbi:cyanophycin synthetase [Clostridium estertheticum]|uniref:Cyanophycin synthetase n=1 Tax=Clostridium estertheticum TaxID=238834 RepID=A0AA47ENF2_9CLOT|nr:cyanophycin synthetase [Clostridium estertheticum]MBU3157654.1 cyanophycin synthetase [Clostridium estertheticum]WAG62554.1 cyanophycin synthetase [Clostridium estertheticum]